MFLLPFFHFQFSIFNFQLIYGIKITNPTIAAAMAHISTAPAAMSFTSPAIGCHSGDTKIDESLDSCIECFCRDNNPDADNDGYPFELRCISKIKPAIITNIAIAQMNPYVVFPTYKASDSFPCISKAFQTFFYTE